MKKKLLSIIAFVMIAITMLSMMATTCAAFSWDMNVGETFSLGFSNTPYVSSDTSVVEIRHEGGSKYTAVAVGKGKATVTGGTWMGHNQDTYEFTVYSSEAAAVIGHMGFFFYIIIALLAFMIAEIVYIYIAAPKCGMSRLWALVPVFSNILGLIVFIVVRSNNKIMAKTAMIICPVCKCTHPEGTAFCSVCGNKLQ